MRKEHRKRPALPHPELEQSAAMREIGQLHELTWGDPRILIAVLDGPADTTHPTFRDARLTVLDGAHADAHDRPAGGDASAHGTHVTSVILGHEGIAPACRGLVIPIYDEDQGGSVRPASQETLATAIHQAIDAGVHIINISGGQLVPSGTARPELVAAVERCRQHNRLIVAAAGNDGCACLHVPGALPSVLAVAASDDQGRPLPSSNWSGPYQAQGILAPGQDIPGALPAGGMGHASGSSYATAVTSGVAALMLSAQVEGGRPADPHAARRAILSTVSRCDPEMTAHCHRHLAGHLNPRAAMSLINQGENLMTDADASIQDLDSIPSPDSVLSTNSFPAANATAAPEAMRPSSLDVNIARPAISDTLAPAIGVEPSDCACGGGVQSQLAYVLGQIDYDFGTLENFDWFKQNAKVAGQFINPNDPEQVLRYLDDNPEFASTLIWTVTLAGVPVYAIHPEECFCDAVYKRLRQFLADQLKAQKKNQVSISTIPARIHGSNRLLNGAVVPLLAPDPRGMFNFTEDGLIENMKELCNLEKEPSNAQKAQVHSYLSYLVDVLRNLGRTAGDRAINYLATQAYAGIVGASDLSDPIIPIDKYRLYGVTVAPNAFCQPGGDCQDVTLEFFVPEQALDIAPLKFRQTVDVAAVNPVLVGKFASFRTR